MSEVTRPLGAAGHPSVLGSSPMAAHMTVNEAQRTIIAAGVQYLNGHGNEAVELLEEVPPVMALHLCFGLYLGTLVRLGDVLGQSAEEILQAVALSVASEMLVDEAARAASRRDHPAHG